METGDIIRAKRYIQAITSWGGERYELHSEDYTEENRESYVRWMREQPKVEGAEVYRGVTLSMDYYNDGCIEVGNEIFPTAMTTSENDDPSFTTSPLRAITYMRQYGDVECLESVRCLFTVHTIGKSFVDIRQFSIYPNENEFKALPNARFKVLSIKSRGGYREIELQEL